MKFPEPLKNQQPRSVSSTHGSYGKISNSIATRASRFEILHSGVLVSGSTSLVGAPQRILSYFASGFGTTFFKSIFFLVLAIFFLLLQPNICQEVKDKKTILAYNMITVHGNEEGMIVAETQSSGNGNLHMSGPGSR